MAMVLCAPLNVQHAFNVRQTAFDVCLLPSELRGLILKSLHHNAGSLRLLPEVKVVGSRNGSAFHMR
jgi:hypothetical protein